MHKLIVMGVAGSGKSTLALHIATALGCTLVEGDDYHLPQSQDKMRRGIALEDSDREPWLDRLGELMAEQTGSVVLTCSALKRRYRDRLRATVAGLQFVFIDIPQAQAADRLRSRPAHLFPHTLVASQFQALESPIGEVGVLAVAASKPTAGQVEAVLRWLETAEG
ncbi:MAG: gluconokinase [Pseudomonadota bacterium]|nr:gluconokinase [Pseudomonadota bacterium]